MNWGKSAMIKFKVVLVLSLGFGTVVEVTPFIKQPSLIARERVRIIKMINHNSYLQIQYDATL